MKRTLLASSGFKREVRRLTKRHPIVASPLRSTLKSLTEDAFHPSLKTHKLKGRFAGSWSCSVGYDLRIVFDFIEHEGSEAVLLLSVGTHDAVY